MRDIYKKKSGIFDLLSEHNSFAFLSSKVKQFLILVKKFVGKNWQWSDLLVVVLYALLIVLLTWPLVWRINEFIPGVQGDGGDSWHFVWNLWWIQKVITERGDLFFTEYLYYPNGVSLVFHTMTIASGLVGYFLMKFFNLITTFNVIYLTNIFLAAWFTYVLSLRLWNNRKAAFLAGIIFAFSPYFFAHSLGHFNLTVLWPFPLLAILLIEMDKKNSWFGLILMGCVLAYIFLIDFQYYVMSIMLAGAYCIVRVGSDLKILKTKWFWMQIFVPVVVNLLLVFPVLLKSLLVAQDYLPSALMSEINTWSADLSAFLVPSFLSTFWGSYGREYFGLYNLGGVEGVVYVGWVVLFLVVLSLFWRDEKLKVKKIWWFAVLILFFILSLGPFLKVRGVTDFQISDMHFSIPLPYLIFYKIPFLSVARVPARFFAVISLALAVLSAYSFSQFDLRFKKFVNGWYQRLSVLAVVVLSIIILVEYASWPISLQSTSIPVVYEKIRNDPGDFVVMELPLWWTSGHRSLGDVKTKIQYYQTYHEKKILNGSVSRVPNALYDYYLNLPGIKYLIDVDTNQLDDVDKDKNKVLKTMVDDLDIKYVVLHKKYYNLDEYYRIREFFENVLGQVVWYEDENELLYFVRK